MTNFLSESKMPYFINQLYGNIPVASHDEVDSLYDEYVGSIFRLKPPTSDEEFDKLTWSQVKELANQCAAGDRELFEQSLGFSKEFTINGYGTMHAQLVALNYYDKVSGGKSGFVFLTKECIPYSYTGNADAVWGVTSIIGVDTRSDRIFLRDNILPNLENGLKNVVEPFYVTAYGDSDGTVVDTLSLPCCEEVASKDRQTPSNFHYISAKEYDWFAAHNEDDDREKYTNGYSTNAYLSEWRTRDTDSLGPTASMGTITKTGKVDIKNVASASVNIAFIFCL